MATEIDIWQSFVVPKLQAAGWETESLSIAKYLRTTASQFQSPLQSF